jgi:hypothetical protein
VQLTRTHTYSNTVLQASTAPFRVNHSLLQTVVRLLGFWNTFCAPQWMETPLPGNRHGSRTSVQENLLRICINDAEYIPTTHLDAATGTAAAAAQETPMAHTPPTEATPVATHRLLLVAAAASTYCPEGKQSLWEGKPLHFRGESYPIVQLARVWIPTASLAPLHGLKLGCACYTFRNDAKINQAYLHYACFGPRNSETLVWVFSPHLLAAYKLQYCTAC